MAASSQATALNTTNIADLLDRVLDKGVVIAGDVKLKLLDIELLTIQLRLVICSVDKAREMGIDWWTDAPGLGRSTRELNPIEGSAEQHTLPSKEEHEDLLKKLESLQRELDEVKSTPWRKPKTP